MKKVIILLLLLIVLVVTLTFAMDIILQEPALSDDEKVEEAEEQLEEVVTGEKIELTMWSYYEDGWGEAIDTFEKKIPHIQINLVTFPYNDYPQIYFNALVGRTAPDIVVIDSPHFGNFTDIEAFVDLYQEPYFIGRYERHFSPALWKMGHSYDQQNMIGVPFVTSPLLTFYRADIMEEYGFPSEPEELAVFMEDPDNWIEIGNTLKEDNKWIVQWTSEILRIFESSTGYYDENFNFLRDNDQFREAIDVAKKAHQQGIVANIDVWNQTGENALRNDRLPMLYMGTWGAEQIKEWVPEQEGLWRATRLPFNVYGWSNSSILSIPAVSPNKDEAWEFVKYHSLERVLEGYLGTVAGILPARNNPNTINTKYEFLGGQSYQKLMEAVMKQTEEPILTPLDERASHIWMNNIYQGVESDLETEEILERVNIELNIELGRDREMLRKMSGIKETEENSEVHLFE